MRKLTNGPKRLVAQFNTCRFQPERPKGERHYKPALCNGLLATSINNEEVTKAELVKEWNALFGPGITGHSPRRSAALQYIRRGWAIAQVGYLGRWKSNIILEYAQEALESMALNVDKKLGVNDLVKNAEQVEAEMRSFAPAVHASIPIQKSSCTMAMVKKARGGTEGFQRRGETQAHGNHQRTQREI